MSLYHRHALAFVFSLPVRKYWKSYCNHPGVGVAQMLKFLVKVFISLYFLNVSMDLVHTLLVVRSFKQFHHDPTE